MKGVALLVGAVVVVLLAAASGAHAAGSLIRVTAPAVDKCWVPDIVVPESPVAVVPSPSADPVPVSGPEPSASPSESAVSEPTPSASAVEEPVEPDPLELPVSE